jgi:hypothetical protein
MIFGMLKKRRMFRILRFLELLVDLFIPCFSSGNRSREFIIELEKAKVATLIHLETL